MRFELSCYVSKKEKLVLYDINCNILLRIESESLPYEKTPVIAMDKEKIKDLIIALQNYL